jgi:membrane protein implicated in regulation of membrane protease activity
MLQADSNVVLPFVDNLPTSLAPVYGVIVLFLCLLVVLFVVSRIFLRQTPKNQLEGAEGIALTVVAANGMVSVTGEIWKARALAGVIPQGERIVVIRRENLILLVEPLISVRGE